MPIRQSEGIWEGTLKNGQGKMRIGTSGFEVDYSFPSRFDNGIGTNPEELIGAAHAGCFSMALSLLIAKAGYTNNNIHTRAKVHLDQPDLVNSLADGQRPKTMRSSGGGMTSQKVKLYSLSTCSHCKAVKNLLAKQDIAVDVVDVDRLEGDQRNQVLEKVKQVNDRVSFPTTVIGDDVIVGFKADRIKKTSNVDIRSGRVSYGGMTCRVDADLWFVIGCGEYWNVAGALCPGRGCPFFSRNC